MSEQDVQCALLAVADELETGLGVDNGHAAAASANKEFVDLDTIRPADTWRTVK